MFTASVFAAEESHGGTHSASLRIQRSASSHYFHMRFYDGCLYSEKMYKTVGTFCQPPNKTLTAGELAVFPYNQGAVYMDKI